jgi:hypothetical protein
MATVLNIVKKSDIYTGMRIFRSEDKALVYSSAPIADVAIADTYTDDAAESGKVYFYGVELYHATDKTQFPIISASNVVDYGPFTASVADNVQKFFSPTIFGDSKMGLIRRATLAQLSGQPAPPNTGEKMREILLAAIGLEPYNKPVADSPMVAALLDGKLVVLPTAVNFYLRNEYSPTNVVSDVTKVVDYLKNNPAQALIDIAGYRWKIKVMSKEFMQKHSALLHSTIRSAEHRSIPHVVPIYYSYAPAFFTYGEADGVVTSPVLGASGTDLTFTFDNQGTNYGRVIYMYFEYVGPTPV